MLAVWYAPSWIVEPMRSLFHFCFNLLGSTAGKYGLAIILMTVAVRVLILPLTIYQTKSMKKMQEVQPKIKELQEKYKDQPDKVNAEMMNLYKTEGVNPFASCLPVIIQMPFLGAVFEVLRNPGFINIDPTHITAAEKAIVTFMGMDLSAAHNPYLTALSVIGMLAQSYLSGGGANTDQNQKMMMYMMPLFFGWISWSMPGGVALYWVTGTIFGLVQQAIYPGFPKLKGMPGPKGEAGAR